MPEIKSEGEAIARAKKMITGYLKKPKDYPRADVKKLKAELAELVDARNAQAAAKAEMKRIIEEKARKFEALRKTIKEQILNSKFDTADDPVKLSALGLDVAPVRKPRQQPAAPRELEVAGQKPGMVHLKWLHPAVKSGGKVRGYIVRRRELKDGEITGWRPHATVFKNEAKLEDEGRSRAFEYHIVATNETGESDPSNTVAVVV